MRIAIDCMGGDFGPSVTMVAIRDILNTYEDLSVIAVGQQALIEQALPSDIRKKAIDFHYCEQVIAMDESPLTALRTKRQSSMAQALDMVRQGKAEACISAGNTGALVALSRYKLSTMPGIDRPAIVTALPTVKKPVYLLDLGANVDCEATHLIQFAKMATIMLQSVENIRPRVGVLNIGIEDIKGNSVVKETIATLQEGILTAIGGDFVGSVEGDRLFEGVADIVVCDGFVGNVALKMTEGTVHLLRHWLKEEASKNLYRKIVAALCFPIWRGLKTKYDPRVYNGATLLGLQGVVVKSHGSADAFAFRHAIEFAIQQIRRQVGDHIAQQLVKQ